MPGFLSSHLLSIEKTVPKIIYVIKDKARPTNKEIRPNIIIELREKFGRGNLNITKEVVAKVKISKGMVILIHFLLSAKPICLRKLSATFPTNGYHQNEKAIKLKIINKMYIINSSV